MKITKVKISELKQAEYNPRRLTKKQHEDLKASLEKFGLVDPIIINSDNTVIGGHQRLKIVRELGASEVPTVRVNLSKEDERELNIRLNKNTGEFDLDVLANSFDMEELKDWGFKEIELGLNIDKLDDTFTLDDSDKSPFQQITFTLADKQAELIRNKLKDIKKQKNLTILKHLEMKTVMETLYIY
jgi:ParB-like chromosome segregation protein Spo0J